MLMFDLFRLVLLLPAEPPKTRVPLLKFFVFLNNSFTTYGLVTCKTYLPPDRSFHMLIPPMILCRCNTRSGPPIPTRVRSTTRRNK